MKEERRRRKPFFGGCPQISWRRGGRLDFSDGKARVFCGDEPFLDIDIDEDDGSEACRYPADMTAEGVFGCCRDK